MALRYVLWCKDPNGNLLKSSGAPYRKIADIGGSDKKAALERTATLQPTIFAVAEKDLSDDAVNIWKGNTFKLCWKQDTSEAVQTPAQADWQPYEPKA